MSEKLRQLEEGLAYALDTELVKKKNPELVATLPQAIAKFRAAIDVEKAVIGAMRSAPVGEAQRLTRLGLVVLPLPAGKKWPPPLKEWQKVERTAETTFAHGGNLAVLCGAASGVTVLDFENDNDPSRLDNQALFDLIVKAHPLAPVVKTWSGGKHIYFAHAPDYPNSVKTQTFGVDIKNDAGYVVAPPSAVSEEGKSGSYSWETPFARENLPDCLSRFLGEPIRDRSGKGAIKYQFDPPEVLPILTESQVDGLNEICRMHEGKKAEHAGSLSEWQGAVSYAIVDAGVISDAEHYAALLDSRVEVSRAIYFTKGGTIRRHRPHATAKRQVGRAHDAVIERSGPAPELPPAEPEAAAGGKRQKMAATLCAGKKGLKVWVRLAQREGLTQGETLELLSDPTTPASRALTHDANGRVKMKGGAPAVELAHAARAAVEQHWETPTASDEAADGDGFLRASGIILNCPHNTWNALEKLGADLRFNEFTACVEQDGERLGDDGFDDLYVAVQDKMRFKPPVEDFHRNMKVLARKRGYHPVKEYLESLPKWDGCERPLFVAYAGAGDTPLNRAFGRLFPLNAVRRIYEPGCKFDEMVVLEDPRQGTNKSTFFSTLAVRPEWFSDHVPTRDPKEFIEATSGRWMLEFAELATFKGVGVEKLKAFLSRQTDIARLAYGRITEHRPRQCVFGGSVNEEWYLEDPTGNRRFWPVRVGEIKIEDLLRDRDQVWAEALERYRRAEPARLDPALWAAAAEEQEKRAVPDDFADELHRYLSQWEVCRVSTANLYRMLRVPAAQQTPTLAKKIGRSMRSLGWRYTQVSVRGAKIWYWVPASSEAPHEPELDVEYVPAAIGLGGKVAEGTGVVKVTEAVFGATAVT